MLYMSAVPTSRSAVSLLRQLWTVTCARSKRCFVHIQLRASIKQNQNDRGTQIENTYSLSRVNAQTHSLFLNFLTNGEGDSDREVSHKYIDILEVCTLVVARMLDSGCPLYSHSLMYSNHSEDEMFSNRLHSCGRHRQFLFSY